ncbi:hypothetical protein ACHAWF_000871, partial [Thalassiosira exigua]
MAQPFLIDRIVSLLGLENNEFEVNANAKEMPVGKPLLNKDLKGKPRKLKWKYRTAVGMLDYLQGNTRPEISMAVHQTARFSIDQSCVTRKPSCELDDTSYIPETEGKGLECYVDTDFADGWPNTDADDANNIMFQTGFIIMYANCPILWVNKLQTKIALSTAEAEYIALSQSL